MGLGRRWGEMGLGRRWGGMGLGRRWGGMRLGRRWGGMGLGRMGCNTMGRGGVRWDEVECDGMGWAQAEARMASRTAAVSSDFSGAAAPPPKSTAFWTNCWSCESGGRPLNWSTSLPLCTSITVGRDWTCSACASSGTVSTFTFASRTAPLAAVTIFSSFGVSFLHGSHLPRSEVGSSEGG